MVHFTRACKTLLSENNKTRLTFEKQQEKNKNIICRPWSVRIEKNCALGLEHGPRPAASGRTQDLWHSFSQYGPPGRQIIYIYIFPNNIYKIAEILASIFRIHQKGEHGNTEDVFFERIILITLTHLHLPYAHISETHFETTLLRISCYGYEISRHK